MDLTWLRTDSDLRDLAGAAAVLEAARATDAPFLPQETTGTFLAALGHGWDGDPSEYAVARDGSRVIGVLEVGRPRWDNHHAGYVNVTVDPLRRREGLGRRLLDAGAERARAAGRTLLLTDCYDSSPGAGFCAAAGLERASREAQRRLDLPSLDMPRLAAELNAATSRAAGYELLRMAGPVPPDLLEDMVGLTAAINDAPIDDLQIEDEVFSAERIRAFEAAQDAYRRRVYRLVARERETGTLAGHTVVAVQADFPWHGWQYDTSVLGAHRGRRLGLLLKISMIGWLAETEPQLRMIDTWNAVSNEHMLRLNEILGCRVVAHGSSWQRQL